MYDNNEMGSTWCWSRLNDLYYSGMSQASVRDGGESADAVVRTDADI